ncbi:MAG: hypothetical protein ACR2K2_10745 [Mycobacteriales bacterium]
MGLPRAVRRQWLSRPSACIDATPMKVPAAMENSRYSSSDPDAGKSAARGGGGGGGI